ncbi:ATP-binding cassette domain-containing protein [Rhizobiaceae bacterium BDR2-2]|uniref:ATP-binding cassette domain-containing protein n=1 Tax=Ectorhizobium quercum TaxID=2965071 RepID=A0AAE3N4Z1_9HYPH|nr:ATP-binding cassette domain-containing protein [Ectorhizobium quercum]MCX8999345.1 ATP-binding cassette domain-containing protein [Ectorhizobium quercum]
MSDDRTIALAGVTLALGNAAFAFDCTLPGGAITAVTGSSGSGKSTLLNLVAGFETPDRGQVLIGGTDVTHLHPSERPVSLVFQDNNLFAHLDLASNIGLGINPALKLSAADRVAVSTALERVGLAGFERRLPGTLSGGERQRAAFARALVRRKAVLLLDEPFAALDPDLRAAMSALLVELHRETGNTVMIVTHDPQEVRRSADHVLFLDHGRIAVDLPAETFLSGTGVAEADAFMR